MNAFDSRCHRLQGPIVHEGVEKIKCLLQDANEIRVLYGGLGL